VARRTNNAFKLASVNLLSGDRSYFDFENERIGLVKKVAEKLSPSVEIVLKSMFRSRSRSRTTIVCLIVSTLLMTVSLVGGFLCWDTSASYADMAIGQNVIAVGNSVLVDKYISLLDPNSNASDLELQSFNFTSSRFILNETFIERLGLLQGIEVVDTRLVTFTQVFEIQNATAELDWVTRETHYVITGDHRSKNCLVVGLDPAHLASSGFTQKTGALNLGSYEEAIVGDSLSEAIFQDPYKQSIRVSSNQSADKKDFKIVNVVVDPINHGMVLYVPLSPLWELFSVDGFNLVLVKVNGASEDVVWEIDSLASQYGLVVRNLDSAHNEYAASIDEIWLSVLPFAMLSVVTAMIGLLNSMFVSVSSRTHDFGILKAIGAKPNYLTKIVFLESSIFVLVTAPVGIIFGTLCVFLFLVPGATLSALFLAASLLGITVILFSMCCLSTLLVTRARKKLPHELL